MTPSNVRPIYRYHQEIIKVPGKSLGRLELVNWEEMGVRKFVPTGVELRSVVHQPTNIEEFDQDGVGACTGFEAEQVACAHPFNRIGSNAEAFAIYKRATEIDPFPGSWPVVDTGSSGWAALQAAIEMGIFTGGSMVSGAHAAEAVAEALQTRGVGLGTDWLSSMDEPEPDGRVKLGGRIRGGHEYAALELQLIKGAEPRIWCRMCWGKFGVYRNGCGGWFYLTAGDLSILLGGGGDACAPDVA